MTNQYHQSAVHAIATEVENLILDEAVRARFTDHIDCFCKMVEDYGQALQPYTKKLKKAEKRIERDKNPERFVGKFLTDICPPPKDWVKMNYLDNCFINVPMSVIYRPAEPVNPLLWFGIFGSAGIQRKPTKKEKLMCMYVLLAIIHDYELRKPTDTPVFSEKYEGEYFDRDGFRENIWKYYHCASDSQFYSIKEEINTEKLSQLTCALENVRADLDIAERPEQSQKNGEKPTASSDDKTGDVKPIKDENLWRCKSFNLLRQIDCDEKREGIRGDKKIMKMLKEWLNRHRKRPDIAKTLELKDGRIKTTLPYMSIFSEQK